MTNLHGTFAVFADLHVDMMHDTVQRVECLLEDAERRGVSCIFQLGDMMYPTREYLEKEEPGSLPRLKESRYFCERDDEKSAIWDMIWQKGMSMYHVLGNHDLDACSLPAALRYYGMEAPYYTVDQCGLRFIVLDTNYELYEGEYFHLGDASRPNRGKRGWIPPQQLCWLEQQLHTADRPCVVLSHMGLGHDFLSVENRIQVRKTLEGAREAGCVIPLCINGHNHMNHYTCINGITYWSAASISNLWLGEAYVHTRYSETISRVYPHIRNAAPYRSALYAFGRVVGPHIHLQGRETAYVGPPPEAFPLPADHLLRQATPKIESISIGWDS